MPGIDIEELFGTIEHKIPLEDINVKYSPKMEEDLHLATSQVTPAHDDDKERKQFKSCHGQCVHHFCLPVDNTAVFDDCSDKCRNICTVRK